MMGLVPGLPSSFPREAPTQIGKPQSFIALRDPARAPSRRARAEKRLAIMVVVEGILLMGVGETWRVVQDSAAGGDSVGTKAVDLAVRQRSCEQGMFG